MSVERVERQDGEVVYRVRWRDHQGRNRARVLGRRRDALAFEAEVKRRKRMGELAAMDAGRETLDQYVTGSWANAHATHLAPRTRRTYASSYDRHIAPRLGDVPLREFDAELVATFQGELLRAGVGAHAIRKAMTLLGALLQRAAEGGRIPSTHSASCARRGCRSPRRCVPSRPGPSRPCAQRATCARR